MSETMRFMVEVEGHFPRDAMCVRLLSHLQKHCEAISCTPSMMPSTQQQNTPITPTNDKKLTKHQQNERNVDFQLTKGESETNNNNRTEEYDKMQHTDTNGISYKYKNNIKMRFTQDLSTNNHLDGIKRQKTEGERRNSVVSNDNQW